MGFRRGGHDIRKTSGETGTEQRKNWRGGSRVGLINTHYMYEILRKEKKREKK